MTLAAIHEIAEHFGVSRQLAYKWSNRPDFPTPVAYLAMGKVWNLAEVKQWGRRATTPPKGMRN